MAQVALERPGAAILWVDAGTWVEPAYLAHPGKVTLLHGVGGAWAETARM